MDFTGGIIVSVARSEEVMEELICEGKRVLFLTDHARILPDNYLIPDDTTLWKRFEHLDDYDVVEFYSEKRFQVYYRDASYDNALVLTSKCNSNCIMCPCSESYRKAEVLESAEHICRLIEYFPTDVPFLTITGGEPTLIKEGMFDVLEKMKRHFEGTKYFLLTNGRTLSNEKYLNRFLESMPQNIRFCIPIHGYDPETHDYITQARGSFKQTEKALKHLLNHKCEVEIRIVVSKLNDEWMTKIAQYIVSHFSGVAYVNIMATEMCGAAALNRERVWLDYEKCFELSKKAIQILLKEGIDVQLYNFPLCKVEREYWSICMQSISDYKIRYQPQCEQCAVKKICGGVFGTTLALTKMELNPIGEHNV